MTEVKVFFKKVDKDIIEFRNPFEDSKIVELKVNTTIAKEHRLKYLNIYWTYFYEKSPLFKDYCQLLFEKKRDEEYKIVLWNMIDKVTTEIVDIVSTYVDVSSWCDIKKKTQTSIFVTVEESKEVLHLICALIVTFPLVYAPDYWGINVIEKIVSLDRRPIKTLMNLAMSRIRFDTMKSICYFKSLLNPNTAFYANFVFVLFSLVACSSVLVPPEYSSMVEEKKIVNFYGYFVSVVSENQKFIIQSFPQLDVVENISNDEFLRKEINQDIIQTVYSALIIQRILSFVSQTKKTTFLNSLYPTPISKLVIDILRVALKVNPTILDKYPLETQWVFYNVCKKSPLLRQQLRTGLEILRTAARTPVIKKKPGSDLPIVTALMSKKDIPFLDSILNKIKFLNKTKGYELVYIDKLNTPYTGKINKELSDFAHFYVKTVIAEHPKLILEIQRMFNKLGLYVKDIDDVEFVRHYFFY